MTVTDWIGFHKLPYHCEYPDCDSRWIELTHNFDKIKGTHFKRYNSYWDYIYVCGFHFNKLVIRWNIRRDAITKDSLTPQVREMMIKYDPITAWEDYVNDLR